MSTMKRSREDYEESDYVDSLATANCLMLLSGIGLAASSDRMFECKTCNRKFPSFQALGGHRTSHKQPYKSIASDSLQQSKTLKKRKTHECSICGVEFALGQALGGHMRRHRAVIENSSPKNSGDNTLEKVGVPVLKRCNSSKRVLCLDLSLTPYEIDLRLKL